MRRSTCRSSRRVVSPTDRRSPRPLRSARRRAMGTRMVSAAGRPFTQNWKQRSSTADRRPVPDQTPLPCPAGPPEPERHIGARRDAGATCRLASAIRQALYFSSDMEPAIAPVGQVAGRRRVGPLCHNIINDAITSSTTPSPASLAEAGRPCQRSRLRRTRRAEVLIAQRYRQVHRSRSAEHTETTWPSLSAASSPTELEIKWTAAT